MQVLLRADASTKIGTGHVLRCLALGEALIDGGDKVRLHACELPTALAERLRSEGMEISTSSAEKGSEADLAETLARAKDWAHVVVLDGYHFDVSFQEAVRSAGFKTLVMDDDRPGSNYSADILLNQNQHAKPEMYEGANVGQMLLKPTYALLRREFRQQRPRRVSVRTRNVLVTFGGSDPENVTKKVIEGLKEVTLTGVVARVLIGSENPHQASLQEAAAKEGTEIHLLKNVANMPEHYEWADIAIAGGGSTAWELAFMGLPSLMIILVDNQEKIAKSMWRLGIARLLGWHKDVSQHDIAKHVRNLLISSEERDKMARWGQQLVDGQGALRVAASLRELVI